MEEKVVNKKNKKTLLIVGILCFVAIISIVGYTYSFLQITATKEGVITGTAASLDLELNVEKVAPDINKPLVPQLDSAISSAVVGTKGNCVDDNGNAVCQVYEVKVKNTSNTSIKIDGLLRLNVGNNENLKWTLIDKYSDGMTEKPSIVEEINKHQISTITANETYTAQQEKIYYLVVWISETTYVQADTGTFTGTITFKDSVVSSASSNTLYALGIAPNAETPDFSKSSCSSGCGENTIGVYSMEDDLGTSYYFRGDVENNYVYFANKYWRIIRINGDGTVRMIYDGTNAHANGESSTDRRVTISSFNPYHDDNTYVGYMYGTPGATTYADTHSNLYDSDMKYYLEGTWYQTLSATDKGKLADAIYCNDRSLSTSNVSYTGIGTTDTDYAAYQRLVSLTTPEPTLICKNQNDRFTYNASVEGVLGNDKLEAPIGLITADEVVLAGMSGLYIVRSNKKYYLYTGNWYWTMTPSYFEYDEFDYYANCFYVNMTGALRYSDVDDDGGGVRPVINISFLELKNGIGTMDNPFIVID